MGRRDRRLQSGFNPRSLASLIARPWAVVFVVVALSGLFGAFLVPKTRPRTRGVLASSCIFLLGMVAATLAGKYPFWLRSSLDPFESMTASNTIGTRYGMDVALIWCAIGLTLVTGYFVYLFRYMRGKVGAESEGEY